MCEGDIATIPAALRAALAAPPGGQIALVIGAGCSIDPPTSRRTAREYATQAYRQLEERGTIAAGSCNPENLGSLADAVFAARGTQKDLVDILRPQLLNAPAHDGHKLAAALLAEQIVGLILTLNFDRAIDSAVATIAHKSTVTIVHAVEELRNRTRFGVIYLHGNVESEDSKWILRTAQIDQTWDDTWQEYIVMDLALTPNVIFAGLGSPTPVISETVLKAKAALSADKTIIQVDKMELQHNTFAQTMGVAAADYVVSCWTGFMQALGGVAAREFNNKIFDRYPRFCTENRHDEQDPALVMAALPLDILSSGKLRAAWFLDKSEYKAFNSTNVDHLVDIIRTLALALTIVGATECVLVEDGMDFRKDGKPVLRVFSCSGAGALYWANVEGAIQARHQEFRRNDKTTAVVYLATAVDIGLTSVPESIVAEVDGDGVTASPRDFAYFSPRTLNENPQALLDMMRN